MSGARIRDVSLQDSDIFSRRGRLGYEKVLGISGDPSFASTTLCRSYSRMAPPVFRRPTADGHGTRTVTVVSLASREIGRSTTALDDLADATLKGGGLRDVLFVTANAAGDVAAAMLDSAPPGAAVVLRQRGATWAAERRAGNVLLGTSPLIGASDLAQQQVAIDELSGGAAYVAPLRITAVDAGAGGRVDPTDGCGWWGEETAWRVAADRPDRGLLRAVTPPLATWSVISPYARWSRAFTAQRTEVAVCCHRGGRHWRTRAYDGRRIAGSTRKGRTTP